MAGVAGTGIEELEAHLSGKRAGRAVADLHRDLDDVPLAEESGYDRLHHQILGGHRGVEERAGAEARVVGERLELPGGERVGEGELDRHAAVVVTLEIGKEECRLDEVFPGRRRSGGSRVRRWRWSSPLTHGGEIHLEAEGDRRPLGHQPAQPGRGGIPAHHSFGQHRVSHHRRRRHRAAHHWEHSTAIESEELHRLGAERIAEPAEADLDRHLRHRPASHDLLEDLGAVAEQRVHRRRLTAEERGEAGGPGERRERIERLVVEGRHDLSGHPLPCPVEGVVGRLHAGPPDFLRPRFDAAGEPLPGDLKPLVRPGNVDDLLLQMKPAVAHDPRAEREAAAVVVADPDPHRPLRPPRLGPVARKELAVLQHLDEGASLVVAGGDDRLEGAPWLGGHRRRGKHEGTLDRGSRGLGVDDFNRVAGLHVGGAVGSGDDKLRPVNAGGELDLRYGLAGDSVGGVLGFEDLPTALPPFWIIRIEAGKGRREPPWLRSTVAPGGGASGGARAGHGEGLEEVAAERLLRLDEAADRERASGRAWLVIERLRRDGERHLGWRAVWAAGLPGLSLHIGLERRVTGTDGPVGGARLARRIGNVGDHPVGEHRQALNRHAPVGLRRKLDGEVSVGIGRGAAAQNPGRARVKRDPGEEPSAPGGEPHLPLDPVADLRAGHW